MHVGLFGGSFNPPHVGHLIVANEALKAGGFDRLLWIPASRPPHKDHSQMVQARHRFEMTVLATSDHLGFEVSDLELKREGPSFTVQTLEDLSSQSPDDTFTLVMGADSLRDFRTWRQPDRILELATILAYRRSDLAIENLDEELLSRTTIIDAPQIDVSATFLRKRVGDGQSVRYFVPDPVISYIEENGLYIPNDS